MRRIILKKEFVEIVQSLSVMDQRELRSALYLTYWNIGLHSDCCHEVVDHSDKFFKTPYEKVLGDYILMSGTDNKIHLKEEFVPLFAKDMKAVLATPSEQAQSSARFLSFVCERYLNSGSIHPFESVYFDELFAPHMQTLAEVDPAYVIKSVREAFAEDKPKKPSVKAAIPSFVLALRKEFPSKDMFLNKVPELCDYFSNLILAGTYFGARKGGHKAIVAAWKDGMVSVVEHAPKHLIKYLYEKLADEAVPSQLGGLGEKYRRKNGYNGTFVKGVDSTLRAVGIIMFAECGPRKHLINRIQSISFGGGA